MSLVYALSLPLQLIVVPSLYLSLLIFSTSVMVFFISNLSVIVVNFGVPKERGELRVFLLHHLVYLGPVSLRH